MHQFLSFIEPTICLAWIFAYEAKRSQNSLLAARAQAWAAVSSPAGARAGGNSSMLLSHVHMSVSPSVSLSNQ